MNRRRAERVLEQIGLLGAGAQRVHALSHGDQRVLEIGMALVSEPALVLLDEPTSGMGQDETWRMMDLITRLAGSHTILLIEHDMAVVMTVSDRITVLHQGRMLARGSPTAIADNAEVREVYLGAQRVAVEG